MRIETCKKCGFILGTRPNTKTVNGVCLACANSSRKTQIDWGGASGMVDRVY